MIVPGALPEPDADPEPGREPEPDPDPDPGQLSGASPGAAVPTMQAGDQTHLRSVFREFASGVTVVSTRAGGMLHAMTANAFCSVSLAPPQVLVCVAHSARFHTAITESGLWTVSILSADQDELATRFATPGRDLARQFDDVDHVVGGRTDAALLTGARAWLECRTAQAVVAGDHTIVVGDVLGCDVNAIPQAPLTYHRGGYVLPSRARPLT